MCCRLLLACVLLTATLGLAQQSTTAPAPPPGNPQQPAAQYCSSTRKDFPSCRLSKKDAKQAARFCKDALKEAKRENFELALAHFNEAQHTSPNDVDIAAAREIVRQKLVLQILQHGNDAMLKGNKVEALGAFRHALEVDPDNAYAKQQIQDSLPPLPVTKPIAAEYAEQPATLQPLQGNRSLHFRGSAQELLRRLASTYGLNAVVDDSVLNRRVRVDLEDADWPTALRAMGQLTHSLAVPLFATQVLFVDNTEENRRNYGRMSLRTFYVRSLTTPQEMNDLLTTLRVLFDLRFVTQSPGSSTITVRAPQESLDAVSQFLADLDSERPQVMLDIKVFAISRTYTRKTGLNIPNQFTVFNVPTEVNSVLNSSSVQSLASSLGIDTTNLSTADALAALVAAGAISSGSVFGSPFVLFGGGTTLTGVTVPTASLSFAANNSSVHTLQHMTLRASQSSPAVMKIGSRYPIITASYSSASTSSLVSSLYSSTNSLVPQFSYEDLGVNLKATPHIQRTGSVSIDFELQIRALSGTSANSIPIVSNREYKGNVTSMSGEPVILAGDLSHSETNSLSGLPGLGNLPVASSAVSTRSKETTDQELLIIVSPHILTDTMTSSPLITIPDNIPR